MVYLVEERFLGLVVRRLLVILKRGVRMKVRLRGKRVTMG